MSLVALAPLLSLVALAPLVALVALLLLVALVYCHFHPVKILLDTTTFLLAQKYIFNARTNVGLLCVVTYCVKKCSDFGRFAKQVSLWPFETLV